MGVKHYQELTAWQKAMDLVQAVYDATKRFPREEIYRLTSQVRRAAVSIPSNIAEGQGRNSTKEFLHHLSIAYGSLCELETQVLLAQRLQYVGAEQASPVTALTKSVGQLLNGLMRSLRQKEPSP